MSLINTVQIKNFKSVKDLSFSAKRVNVFVGKPNVGKSNILEALSLFCAGYLKVDKKLFEEFIRLNNIRDLFYKRNSDNEILVSTDIGDAILSSLPFEGLYFVIDPQKAVKNKKVEFSFGLTSLANKERFYDFYDKHQESESYKQSPLFYAIGSDTDAPVFYSSPIKRYIFTGFSSKPYPAKDSLFLLPDKFLTVPNGRNIVSMLLQHTDLLQFFAEIFKEEYGLDLVVKSPENILEIQTKDGLITNSTSITLIADTLQRIIFYLTAIKSNTNSVLLLEEPETNSFPTYTNMLADNIARDKSNQYFITTHSPYLLRTLLDETPKDEIAIFVTTYKEHQTHVHSLTGDEISELLDYDIDLFFNFKKYVEE